MSCVSAEALASHLEWKHEPADTIQQCGWCTQQCNDAVSLRMHIEAEHQEFASQALERHCLIITQPLIAVKRKEAPIGKSHPTATLDKARRPLEFPCDLCDRHFSSVAYLSRHAVRHSSRINVDVNHPRISASHRCTECDHSFTHATGLQSHVDDVHKRATADCQRLYECPQCEMRFAHARSVRRHLSTVHQPLDSVRAHQCPECQDTFKQAVYLRRHVNTVHRGVKSAVSQCDDCLRTFTQLVSLRWHVQTMHQRGSHQPVFACAQCPLSYSRPSNLRAHVTQVHRAAAQRAHQCAQCERRFARAVNLRKHLRKGHSTEGGRRLRQCSRCHRTFPTLTRLREHVRLTHLVATPAQFHRCVECENEFSKSTLGQSSEVRKRGIQKHRSVRLARRQLRYRQRKLDSPTFRCAECARLFPCASDLRRHMTTHSGEKRFCCDVCDRRFAYASGMVLHLLLHAGRAALCFECHECLASFTRKGDLTKRCRIHTNEMPYECVVTSCRRRFKTSSERRKHERMAHEVC